MAQSLAARVAEFSASLSDLVMLDDVTEKSVVDALGARYQKQSIYTLISEMVVVVNPFKPMPHLYTPQTMDQYIKAAELHGAISPHLYCVAQRAFHDLVQEGRNQAIIICGESGAGKTEAAKAIIKYLAYASKAHERTVSKARRRNSDLIDKMVDSVSKTLIDSNPALEAFGNAKTLRNNNSSRYGKYVEVLYDPLGRPTGGKISQYLLEKARVVRQADGERNFHVFYQLCAGYKDDPSLAMLKLESAAEYHYISDSEQVSLPGVDDRQGFAELKQSLSACGFSATEQTDIFRCLAGILHLGNIKFGADQANNSTIEGAEATLALAAGLLGVEVQQLSGALLTRLVTAARRASVANVKLTPEQALDQRDALAKSLYERLFSWLVARINARIEPREAVRCRMGVLDIYGFEIFEENGLEQLCINFVNERLQQLFTEQTLKKEQDEYVAEGLDWTTVDFIDTTKCVELLKGPEGKPRGVGGLNIFTALDEESKLGLGTDDSFLMKLDNGLERDPFYVQPPKQQRGQHFGVRHYAGTVMYRTAGIVEKNRDSLGDEAVDLMGRSTNCVIEALFEAELKSQQAAASSAQGAGRDRAGGGAKQLMKPTIVAQFKKQVDDLVTNLKQCNPHYVRCIKPNDEAKALKYVEERVTEQAVNMGLRANTLVWKSGFCQRRKHPDFGRRFRICMGRRALRTPPPGKEAEANRLLLGAIWRAHGQRLSEMGMTQASYEADHRIGLTKVFIRTPKLFFALEALREEALPAAATVLQAGARMFAAKCAFKRALQRIVVVQALARRFLARRLLALTKHRVNVIRAHYLGWRTRRVMARDLVLRLGRAVRLGIRYRGCKLRRRNSILEGNAPKGYDLARGENDYRIQGLLSDNNDRSKILFAGSVKKLNYAVKEQERVIIITGQSFYVCDKQFGDSGGASLKVRLTALTGKGRLKRQVNISEIHSLYLSCWQDNMLVVSYRDVRYDMVIFSESKIEIVDCFCTAYQASTGRRLPVIFAAEYLTVHPKPDKMIRIKLEGQRLAPNTEPRIPYQVTDKKGDFISVHYRWPNCKVPPGVQQHAVTCQF